MVVPNKSRRCSDNCQVREAQRRQSTQPAAHPARGPGTGLFGQRTRFFSLFDLVSSCPQITARKDTVPLTSFCTPTGLYKWLIVPQGISASPGWLVKVLSQVPKGLELVAAYLDDVIVLDPDPSTPGTWA